MTRANELSESADKISQVVSTIELMTKTATPIELIVLLQIMKHTVVLVEEIRSLAHAIQITSKPNDEPVFSSADL